MAGSLPPAKDNYQSAHIQQSSSTSMVAVNVVLPAIATVFVVLRMIASKTTRASWQANDLVLIAALVRISIQEICSLPLLMLDYFTAAHYLHPLYRIDTLRPLWHGSPPALHPRAAPDRSYESLEDAVLHRDNLDNLHIPRQTFKRSPLSPHLRRVRLSTVSAVSPPRPRLPPPLDSRRLLQRHLSLYAGAEFLGRKSQGYLLACPGG